MHNSNKKILKNQINLAISLENSDSKIASSVFKKIFLSELLFSVIVFSLVAYSIYCLPKLIPIYIIVILSSFCTDVSIKCKYQSAFSFPKFPFISNLSGYMTHIIIKKMLNFDSNSIITTVKNNFSFSFYTNVNHHNAQQAYYYWTEIFKLTPNQDCKKTAIIKIKKAYEIIQEIQVENEELNAEQESIQNEINDAINFKNTVGNDCNKSLKMIKKIVV